MSIIKVPKSFLGPIIILVCCCFFPNTAAYSQIKFSQTQIDSSIKKRWNIRKMRSDYPKSAIKIIEVIKRSCPNEIDTMTAIGRREAEQENWQNALVWFTLSLKYDPDDLQTNYYAGICERDLGRYSFMWRFARWPRAQKYFDRVIKIDSTYKDVFYQYALLEHYRQHHFKSIEFVQKHLLINGKDDRASLKLFRLYNYMLHHESGEKTEPWLKSRTTTYDQCFLGEYYRLNGLLEQAKSIF